MWTDSRFYFCMLIIILLIYLILSSILHINGVEKDDPRLAENRRRFRDLVDEFNSDGERNIPLSIAYGYSVYVPGENVAEECIREADKKMYDMKIKMKAARI